jgi:hypothetical protein
MYSKSPNDQASRYVDMIGVRSKLTILCPDFLLFFVSFSGMFDSAVRSSGTSISKSKVAFRLGSSKQGKARRASEDSNWVENM